MDWEYLNEVTTGSLVKEGTSVEVSEPKVTLQSCTSRAVIIHSTVFSIIVSHHDAVQSSTIQAALSLVITVETQLTLSTNSVLII